MSQPAARPPGRSRFLSNTAALGVSTAVSTLFTLAQVKILAAGLSMETFGLFAALRGLSLLVAMLAANGLPHLLIRYLPVHESRGDVRRAVTLSVVCAGAATATFAVLVAVLHALRFSIVSNVPLDVMNGPFLFWFYATTLGVTLKLVLYGGLNGLRRLSSQTWLESASLLIQVGWIFAIRDRLDLPALFMILGVVSLGTVMVGAPWYARHLRRDTRVGDDRTNNGERPAYASYWMGATGLGLVAIAFTDVDRYLLSGVLALELLSLFHIGSRVVRLANRFMGIPVLSFQPEVSRLDAEGRGDEIELSTRVFLKFNIVTSLFIASGVAVFASEIIQAITSSVYLGARPLLLVMCASIPLTAITAPITTLMKARDDVRRAFLCDLSWALTYVIALILLGKQFGLLGAGYAHIAACVAQLLLAQRLSHLRLAGAARHAFGRALLACAAAYAPAILVGLLPLVGWARVSLRLALLVAGVWVFRRALIALHVLGDEERDRLTAILARTGLGSLAGRLLT